MKFANIYEVCKWRVNPQTTDAEFCQFRVRRKWEFSHTVLTKVQSGYFRFQRFNEMRGCVCHADEVGETEKFADAQMQ